jgi:hypothetical protein
MAQMETPAQIAARLLAGASSGATAASSGDSWPNTQIPRYGTYRPPSRNVGTNYVGGFSPVPRPHTVAASQYMQEFYEKWEDPNFQTWMMSRAIASGQVSGKDGTYQDYLNLWEAAGKAVASGNWAKTPEQYIEWIASGQSVTAREVAKAIASGEPILDANGLPILPGVGENAPVNPITTHRSTSSATINREAAYAAADQLSMQLLGRMATKAEMRKARGVMNKLLAANPTVSTTTTDQTDPNNVVSTTDTTDGMSAEDAQAALAMKIRRSSEGTAYTVGTMFEDAMRILAGQEG